EVVDHGDLVVYLDVTEPVLDGAFEGQAAPGTSPVVGHDHEVPAAAEVLRPHGGGEAPRVGDELHMGTAVHPGDRGPRRLGGGLVEGDLDVAVGGEAGRGEGEARHPGVGPVEERVQGGGAVVVQAAQGGRGLAVDGAVQVDEQVGR